MTSTMSRASPGTNGPQSLGKQSSSRSLRIHHRSLSQQRQPCPVSSIARQMQMVLWSLLPPISCGRSSQKLSDARPRTTLGYHPPLLCYGNMEPRASTPMELPQHTVASFTRTLCLLHWPRLDTLLLPRLCRPRRGRLLGRKSHSAPVLCSRSWCSRCSERPERSSGVLSSPPFQRLRCHGPQPGRRGCLGPVRNSRAQPYQ